MTEPNTWQGAVKRHATALRIGGFAVAILFLALLPSFASRSVMQDLFFVFTLLALAQYWNLLAGYAGLVSVGQQAFVGLGAYTLFAAVLIPGWDPLVGIGLGGVIAAVLAFPAALLVFRLRGAYFGIGTWVVAEVCRLVLAQIKALGGGTGTSLGPEITNHMFGVKWIATLFGVRAPAAREIEVYWLALILLLGTLGLVFLLLRSRRGLGLAAIRDSETAAVSLGVDSFRARLFIYVVAAFGTGMVGALIYLQKARLSPDAGFSVLDWTAYVIFIVVIGGIGTIEGPIVGAVVLYFMQDYLATFGTWYLMALGALAAGVMLVAPRGLWGYLAERFDVQIFPLRRRLLSK
jgi:branched-chain amino acid transport system permease protein